MAKRDGTMWPSASLCVRAHDDEKPIAPASSPARSSACIASSSSGFASRAVASSPITTRRIAEWPTMKPALIPSRPSISPKYSAVDFQFHGTPSRSDSSGMPSTRASMRIRYSPSAASSDSGAMVKPQLPASAVVTPCSGDGVSAPSQNTCAS